MSSPEAFDAFKTDLKLAMLTLKNELQKDIRQASEGVLIEVRERLGRNADERKLYNDTLDDRLKHIDKVAQETRDFARETNGQVKEHKRILKGDEEDKSDEGLIGKVRSNTLWRNALITAGGMVSFFGAMMWMGYGDAIRDRGIINRPASDYVEFVDIRIKQWLGPNFDKPTQPPPNLVPDNKNGTKNPN